MSADPSLPVVIAATADNIVEGQIIRVTNLTSGGTVTMEMNAKGQISVELIDDPNDGSITAVNADDVLSIERQDSFIAVEKIIHVAGKQIPKLTLTGAANASPSFSL